MIKKKIFLTLLFIFLSGVLVLSNVSSDLLPMDFQELQGPPEHPEDSHHWVWQLRHAFSLAEKNLFEANFILRKADKISLTAAQEQKIETIMMAYQETCLRIGAEIKIRELRLASAIKSDHLDKTKMAEYIREISTQKTDWVVKYFNYLLDLRELLTQKQLAILSTLNQEKKGTRQKEPPTL